MYNTDRVKIHDEHASTYDSQAKDYNSYGHEILFGMCYEYIEAGNTLLDLGIGTGLSSVNFAKAGLHVQGIDASPGMLKECEKKGFAQKLLRHSLTNTPLPYPDNSFSHVICCGVFHFFDELRPYISEAQRLCKKNGVVGFTIASITPKDLKKASENAPDFVDVQTPWNVSIFKHSDNYIHSITRACGLVIKKEQKVLIESGDNSGEDILFKSIVTIKNA